VFLHLVICWNAHGPSPSFLLFRSSPFTELQAGCEVVPPEGETEIPECHGTVYGIKPSSLVTTLVSFLSIAVAFLTPAMGAVIDYTHHRQRIGRTLAAIYCCLLFPLIFLSEATWFPFLVLLVLTACNAVGLTLAMHAYLPEVRISKGEESIHQKVRSCSMDSSLQSPSVCFETQLTDSEDELNDFTRTFTAGTGALVILFVVTVMAVALALGVSGDEVATARIAAFLGFLVLGLTFGVAWGLLFEKRPAMNTLPEGHSLLTEGFKQIGRTSKGLYRNNRALLWFFYSVAFGDVKPLTSIGLTFISNQQQFTSMDVGIAAMALLFSTIPGAILSSYVSRKLNPIRGSVIALLGLTAVTYAGSIFLTGPNQKPQTFVIIALWGVTGGMKVVSTNMLVASILPEGHDAELMGFYLFADISLSWLPPIIFTAINEAGLSERLGLSSTTIFYLLALIGYWKMGTYEDCLKAANRLHHLHHDSGVRMVESTESLKVIAEEDDVPMTDKQDVEVALEVQS